MLISCSLEKGFCNTWQDFSNAIQTARESRLVSEIPDEGGCDVVQLRRKGAERLKPLEMFYAFLQMPARRPLR